MLLEKYRNRFFSHGKHKHLKRYNDHVFTAAVYTARTKRLRSLGTRKSPNFVEITKITTSLLRSILTDRPCTDTTMSGAEPEIEKPTATRKHNNNIV